MSIEYSFFDPTLDESGLPDREYNAEQFTNYFGALVETGIMRQYEQELIVTVDDSTMNSTIGTGVAFVEDKYMRVKSPYLLTHDTESVGLSRIDRVIVRKDTRIESRHVLPFVKKGVAAVNPVAPPLQRDDEVYEISLAQIKVVGGRSYLATNDVTDERTDVSLCGWATSKIMPNYSDDTLQGVLTQAQENDVRIGNHEKNAINHVAYGVATGTNAKTMTANIQFNSLVDGLAVAFKNNTENTGIVTLNVNGKGAKPVIKADGRALVSGDLKAGSIYTVRYNSTTQNFILQGEGGGYKKASGYKEVIFSINSLGETKNVGVDDLVFAPSLVIVSVDRIYSSAYNYRLLTMVISKEKWVQDSEGLKNKMVVDHNPQIGARQITYSNDFGELTANGFNLNITAQSNLEHSVKVSWIAYE